MRGRGERADDALRALRASMGRSLVSYHGEHYGFDDLVVEPHAVNEHVPFWIGGRSRRSLRARGRARRRVGAVRAEGARSSRPGSPRSIAPTGFEVVAQPGSLVDPVGDPARVDELLGPVGEPPAPRSSNLHLVHHSLAHYLEQLDALAS